MSVICKSCDHQNPPYAIKCWDCHALMTEEHPLVIELAKKLDANRPYPSLLNFLTGKISAWIAFVEEQFRSEASQHCDTRCNTAAQVNELRRKLADAMKEEIRLRRDFFHLVAAIQNGRSKAGLEEFVKLHPEFESGN